MLTTGASLRNSSRPRVRLPMPHTGQRYVREHRQRTTWLAAGRRWRKTTLCVTLMIEAALTGEPIIWGAPTYDQVWTAWEETQRACRGVAAFNQARMTATLGRGQMIFRSLDDPDNARSKTAAGIIIDEAADVSEGAYAEVLLPMLMDTGGWLIAAGTPKGRNWFWRECMAAWQGDRPDAVMFQAPSLGVRITPTGLEREPHPLENPHLSFAEIEHLYRTMPERSFRQEVLAEFIDDTGGVFRGVADCATAQPQQRIDGHLYVMGCDWGKYNDYTVLTVIDATTHCMVALDRFNQIDYRLQLERVKVLADRYQPETIVAEKNAMGDPIIEQLFYEHNLPVHPFVTTNASKAKIIDALSLAFERQSLAILNDPVLIGELQAYEATRLPSGLLRYGAPEGMHDDVVMSLALAWYGAQWANPVE